MFLQDLIFNVTDFFIIVVNDLTWLDQEYISSIGYRLKKRSNLNQKEENVAPILFVIHNFKEAKTMHEVKTLWEEQVLKCFEGNVNYFTLENGSKVEYYISSIHGCVEVRHLVTGRFFIPEIEEHNENTFHVIRSMLQAMKGVRPFTLLEDIHKFCDISLSGYISGSPEVKWCEENDGRTMLKCYPTSDQPLELRFKLIYNSSGSGTSMHDKSVDISVCFFLINIYIYIYKLRQTGRCDDHR